METIEELIQSINNSHKTLWIVCGFPYSGKTYIGKKILEQTSCVYVSIDNILEELHYDWNTNKLPNKEGWKKVFDISYQQIGEALGKDLNVLYDSTNHTRVSRDVLREVAKSVNADARVIYIDVPAKVIIDRWQENKKEKSRFVLDENLLHQTIEAMEIPTDDEKVIVIKNY
ncbi:MAG: ATP-binding protein [Candidatus Staskawiczbacteria bacterium]|nr:ATP-binding protein [Candidatus Staskawiczbacteria bacterium]